MPAPNDPIARAGEEIFQATCGFVDRSVAPLRARIIALEQKGANVEAQLAEIRKAVDDAIARLDAARQP